MSRLLSVFSGCGGLDLGFKKAGFDIIWANDNWSGVWETYEKNFPETPLNKESLGSLDFAKMPDDISGIIGGPPCQSWSNAGTGGGLDDKRGQLFITFIELLKAKRPMFFLAENVKGMLAKRNKQALQYIRELFDDAGFVLYEKCLNSNDYKVPQNRERLIFIGIRKDIPLIYHFPTPLINKPNVREAICDLEGYDIPAKEFNQSNKDECIFSNHEYYSGGYSYIFMSRNRVLDWDSPSFTIQASGRQTSIHPRAPKMIKVARDVRKFVGGKENLYRRLTVRECARLQSFPDDFIFHYNNVDQGYKMIGNAVPVNLSYYLAKSIMEQLGPHFKSNLSMKIRTSEKKEDINILKLEEKV